MEDIDNEIPQFNLTKVDKQEDQLPSMDARQDRNVIVMQVVQ